MALTYNCFAGAGGFPRAAGSLHWSPWSSGPQSCVGMCFIAKYMLKTITIFQAFFLLLEAKHAQQGGLF